MRPVAIVFLAMMFAGCAMGPKPVSFREQVQPVLTKHCVKCHGSESPKGRIALTSYEEFAKSRTVSGKAPLAIPGKLDQSRVYILCATEQTQFRMPPASSGEPALTASELEVLGKWIMQGAKDN